MVAAPPSARKLVARLRHQGIVAAGLVLVAVALLLFSPGDDDQRLRLVGAVLVVVGLGMGSGDGAGDRLDHGLAARRRRPASARPSTTPPARSAARSASPSSAASPPPSTRRRITGEPGVRRRSQQASPQAAARRRRIRSGRRRRSWPQTVGGTGAAPSIQRSPTRPSSTRLGHTVFVGAVVAARSARSSPYVFLPARGRGRRRGRRASSSTAPHEFAAIGADQRRSLARPSTLEHARRRRHVEPHLQRHRRPVGDLDHDAAGQLGVTGRRRHRRARRDRPQPGRSPTPATSPPTSRPTSASSPRVLATAHCPRDSRRPHRRGVVEPGAGDRRSALASSNPAERRSPRDSPKNRTRSPSPSTPPSTSSPGRSTSERCSPTRRPTTSSSTPSSVHSSSPIAQRRRALAGRLTSARRGARTA